MANSTIFKQEFPYVASGADIRQILSDMGRRTGLTVRIDEAVQGQISVDNADGTVGTLLGEVLDQSGATWWYDGVILYIEPQAGLTTVLVVSQGLSLTSIRAELDTLDLLDDRFPLTSTADGAVIRIAGPSGYVTQVQSLINTLITTRRARTGTPEEIGLYVPRVYYGRALN